MRQRIALLTLICFCHTPAAWAEWTLNNDHSQLSFVSIKAGDIGEVHRFNHLSGGIASDGKMTVAIQLASVDTAIAIRDERMQALLFDTELFPRATVIAQLAPAALAELEVGSATALEVPATVTLHGRELTINAEVLAARLNQSTLLVTSLRPIIVNAGAVGLSEGVERLREIAGLPAISQAVPVTFTLSFDTGD